MRVAKPQKLMTAIRAGRNSLALPPWRALPSALVAYRHPLAFLLGLEGVALSGTYDQPGNPLIDLEQPLVREILDRIPPGAALDAACGTGRHSGYLSGLGHQMTGVDSSPDMLAQARKRVPAARFLAGDLHRLPVRAQAADLVVCALALTHVPALAPVLAEFARVLQPGGHLVISDIHVMSLYGPTPAPAGSGARERDGTRPSRRERRPGRSRRQLRRGHARRLSCPSRMRRRCRPEAGARACWLRGARPPTRERLIAQESHHLLRSGEAQRRPGHRLD
jgi:SAM-dependent methyltransferase